MVFTVGERELEDCDIGSCTGAEECDTKNFKEPIESPFSRHNSSNRLSVNASPIAKAPISVR